MSLLRNLQFQILISIVLAVSLGLAIPGYMGEIGLVSDMFLRLIKMLIAPLVFSTLVVGMAKLRSAGEIGRIGLKTLAYFYLATVVSLLVGLALVYITQPGSMLTLELPNKEDLQEAATEVSLKTFLYKVFPTSIVKAMAENEILQIVLFSLFFGAALQVSGTKGKPMQELLESLAEIILKMTGLVMKLAPIGVFAALGSNVAKHGSHVLSSYAYLILVFYAGLAFFGFVLLPLVCRIAKVSFVDLWIHIKEACMLAFSTASSESAFPKLMDGLHRYGLPSKITGFVLPLGYSFNLDATMMYMTFAIVFIAQSYDIRLEWSDQMSMIGVLLIASKGVAGVPRASLVIITSMLGYLHLPAEGVLLLLGIDHVLDMGRSAVNVVGNAVAAVVISKWEGHTPTTDSPTEIKHE